MKLFKKVAAVALAAVLALSMVGCGVGNKAFNVKDEVLNYASDVARTDYSRAVNHVDSMDKVAEKLIVEANNAYTKNADVDALLVDTKVVKAAGIDTAKTGYYVLSGETADLQSEMMKTVYLNDAAHSINNIQSVGETIGNPGNLTLDDDMDIGAAVGKIGDKEYIVIVAKAAK